MGATVQAVRCQDVVAALQQAHQQVGVQVARGQEPERRVAEAVDRVRVQPQRALGHGRRPYERGVELRRLEAEVILPVPDGAAGLFAVIPDDQLEPPQVIYADCLEDRFAPCDNNLASADLGVGTVPLCTNECGTPVEETSWGAVKSMFD